MRFAIVDGQRVPAVPGLAGDCPMCGAAMVPRCGTRRVWHWAHRAVRNCEDWWEPETAWHRAWKDEFPVGWQEIIHVGKDGERHIADVRTPHDLIIEFQYSRLLPVERAAREAFYGNMVWVVNGTRQKSDVDRFLGWKDYLYPPTCTVFLKPCSHTSVFRKRGCVPQLWSYSISAAKIRKMRLAKPMMKCGAFFPVALRRELW